MIVIELIENGYLVKYKDKVFIANNYQRSLFTVIGKILDIIKKSDSKEKTNLKIKGS